MNELINKIKNCDAYISKPFILKKTEGVFVYLEAGFDVGKFNDFIFEFNKGDYEISKLHKHFPGTFEKITTTNINFYLKNLADGRIFIFFEKLNLIYMGHLNNIPIRSISPSEFDPVNFFGSKESFIENIKVNFTLITKRIKSDNLKYIDYEVGTITKSIVRLVYIDSFIKKSIIIKIDRLIKNIVIKGIKTIGDITERLNTTGYLPSFQVTSSIESTQNYLLNGRAIIMVDNFPVVIVLPITLDAFTNLPDEAASPNYYLLYTRGLTYILYIIAVFLLGFYITIINYHSNCLSLQMISEIKTASKGSTLPLIGEIIFITFVFEFLRIASSKTPSSNIQSLVITVGGLLIGQNTVSSGFVSPFNLVITALSYLSTYGVTNNKHLIISISYQRIFILISSYFLGILGFISSSIIILNDINSKHSFGIKYFSPLTLKGFKEMLNSKLKDKSLLTIKGKEEKL